VAASRWLVPAERRMCRHGRQEQTMKQRESADPAKKKEDTVESNAPLQGEGNYTAGRRYDKAQEEFANSGQVDEAARRAAPQSEEEREAMKKAEEEGRRHARK
jgi:hypothetical protein